MKSRRIAVIASALGLLMVAGTAATAAPQTGKGREVRPPRYAPAKIATYNVESGIPADAVVADLRKLADAGAQIIGLQEMGAGTRREVVRAQFIDCATCVFDAFMLNTREQNATPILYRSDRYQLLGTGTKQVSVATNVGSSGAGPNVLKGKFVNYVHLRQVLTGRSLYVLNNHAVPSVQGSGGGANLSHPARLRLYRQHMDGLKSLITTLRANGEPVFVTGDFNVNYRRDVEVQESMFPYRNMSQVDVHASYEALGVPETGTHRLAGGGNDTRLIDYVFYLRHANVIPKEQQILEGYRSDHRPVLVRFRILR